MSGSKNRWVAVAALAVAAGALAFIAFGSLGNNLVYYWNPTELKANAGNARGATIRLGGIVEKGSVRWDAAKTELQFRVADSLEANATSVAVIARETPPQMFREGIGVVVEGTPDSQGTFVSNRLMVNHSNEYRPPAPGEKPKAWGSTLANTSDSK